MTAEQKEFLNGMWNDFLDEQSLIFDFAVSAFRKLPEGPEKAGISEKIGLYVNCILTALGYKEVHVDYEEADDDPYFGVRFVKTGSEFEVVTLHGLDRNVKFDPKKVRPLKVENGDIYDMAVITEGPEPLLIGFNDGLNDWVSLGSPNQQGWHWVFPDPNNAEEVAQAIRSCDHWQLDKGEQSPERMLCKLAGMEQELEDSDAYTFEAVINNAAHKLGVNICG